jgi:Ankyrin repeats (3 copies)/Ankyrin repeat
VNKLTGVLMKKAALLLLIIFCRNACCSSLPAVNNHKLIQEQQQEAQINQEEAQINQASAAEILTDLSNLSTFAQEDLPSLETEIIPELTDKKATLFNYSTFLISLVTTFGIIGLVAWYKSLIAPSPPPSNSDHSKEARASQDQGKHQTFFFSMPSAFLGGMMGKCYTFFCSFAKLSPRIKNKLGLRLIKAIKENNTEDAKNLILQNANLDVKEDDYDRTPLHWAVEKRLREIVQLLLLKGANPNIKNNNNGNTPLYYAVEVNDHIKDMSPEGIEKRQKIVNLLLDNGADINIQNQYGETPLHRAIGFLFQEEIVLLLLEKGAKIDIADKNGKTPLDCAERTKDANNYDLKQLLNRAKNKE